MRRLWKWLALGLVVVVGLAFAGWYCEWFMRCDVSTTTNSTVTVIS